MRCSTTASRHADVQGASRQGCVELGRPRPTLVPFWQSPQKRKACKGAKGGETSSYASTSLVAKAPSDSMHQQLLRKATPKTRVANTLRR